MDEDKYNYTSFWDFNQTNILGDEDFTKEYIKNLLDSQICLRQELKETEKDRDKYKQKYGELKQADKEKDKVIQQLVINGRRNSLTENDYEVLPPPEYESGENRFNRSDRSQTMPRMDRYRDRLLPPIPTSGKDLTNIHPVNDVLPRSSSSSGSETENLKRRMTKRGKKRPKK
uniref:uncharacterized protein LOC120338381 n=1 Tax=Styela clava TaxID=7725 RepID=UPI001939CD15|nr:uncharacterized protein LOC120338381 [Styela clava]XP_039262301.1 uncharacterized protein LOC120338381 [Styela clava]